MNWRIRHKVFLLLGVVSVTAVLLVLVLIRYGVRDSFENYLYGIERQQAEPLALSLGAYFAEAQSWAQFSGNHPSFGDYLRQSDFQPGPANRPPPRRGPESRRGPGWPPRNGPPLSLLDESGGYVAGAPELKRPVQSIPITADGKVVGFLQFSSDKRLSEMGEGLEREFLADLSLYLVGAGLATLVVAAGLAFWLSHRVTDPITELAQGTDAMTQGDFDYRVPVGSNDELGTLAQGFNRMAKQLEQHRETQERWIADISHELRTPLSILHGEIQALIDGVRKPERKQLESLAEEVTHLNRLVDDLYQVSAQEHQTLQYRFEPVAINRLLENLVELFTPRFEQAGVVLGYSSTITDVMLEGDRDRLMQLFSNLLENSLRYTDKPGKTQISIKTLDNTVEIQIADSEPGVQEEDMQRLFDRLYRVERSRNRNWGGSGLGLSICKTVVEAHGGTIVAKESTLGGLCIVVGMPYGTLHSNR